jgi:hypothetical protein
VHPYFYTKLDHSLVKPIVLEIPHLNSTPQIPSSKSYKSPSQHTAQLNFSCAFRAAQLLPGYKTKLMSARIRQKLNSENAFSPMNSR